MREGAAYGPLPLSVGKSHFIPFPVYGSNVNQTVASVSVNLSLMVVFAYASYFEIDISPMPNTPSGPLMFWI